MRAEIILFDPSDSTAGLITLPFHEIRPGVEARTIFGRWGVWLDGRASVPTTRVRNLPVNIGVPVPGLYIVNEAVSGTSADKALVVDSRFPLRRILLSLRTERIGEAVATIRVFNNIGELLGTVVFDQFVSGNETLVGIEDTEMQMTKIVIDYGAVDEPEQLGRLELEFASQRNFVEFLPQVGNGRLPTDEVFSTTIGIFGIYSMASRGIARFFDSGGNPLVLSFLDGHVGTSREFSIGDAPVLWETDGDSEVAVGYVEIESDFPVEASAIFTTLGSEGRRLHQAGVAAVSAKSFFKALVVAGKSLTGPSSEVIGLPVDTGIAIVNTSTESANLRLILSIDQGEEFEEEISLSPGAHRARFIAQDFPEVGNEPFAGTLKISSDQPIVVTVLQTEAGFAASSLPAAGIQP